MKFINENGYVEHEVGDVVTIRSDLPRYDMVRVYNESGEHSYSLGVAADMFRYQGEQLTIREVRHERGAPVYYLMRGRLSDGEKIGWNWTEAMFETEPDDFGEFESAENNGLEDFITDFFNTDKGE